MTAAERNLLRSMCDAFNARDIDAVVVAMHQDVDWPNGWEGGRIHGREAIREYCTRQWKAIDPYVEPVAFDFDHAGRIVVRLQQLVRDLQGNFISQGVRGLASI